MFLQPFQRFISIVFSNYNSNYAYSHIQGQCSIHCTDADGKLIELKTPEIWEKILNAGKIRRHIVADVKVDSDSGLPSYFWYHRKCYQCFTLKRTLEQLKSKQPEIRETIDT